MPGGRRVAVGRRNLFEDRRRALMALGGVGSGLLMVLVMSGILAGFVKQATAYVDASPADLIVSQAGVDNMQMSVSLLAPDTPARARPVPGVAWAEPLRELTMPVEGPGGGRAIAYVFGFDPGGSAGRPRAVAEGRLPGPGELVLDGAGAAQLGAGIGDEVQVAGRRLRVSGLTEGLTSVTNTAAFVTADQFALLAGEGLNYVLVGVEPGADAAAVADRLVEHLPGVTAQTRDRFAGHEADLVRDTYADVIRIMIAIGFVIALALVALTLSVVTTSKLREYGVLKALGATPRDLALLVLTQATWAVVTATALAAAGALVLARVIAVLVPNILLVVEPRSVIATLVGALVVGVPAALLPLRRVLAVDPASAFRGG